MSKNKKAGRAESSVVAVAFVGGLGTLDMAQAARIAQKLGAGEAQALGIFECEGRVRAVAVDRSERVASGGGAALVVVGASSLEEGVRLALALDPHGEIEQVGVVVEGALVMAENEGGAELILAGLHLSWARTRSEIQHRKANDAFLARLFGRREGAPDELGGSRSLAS